MYRRIIKPILFLLNPESAHRLVFNLLNFFSRIPGINELIGVIYKVDHPSLRREVFGLTFPNPVGLAAGFDKDAELFGMLSSFGFGFVEIGTVTPLAQEGNPRPRMFRLPENNALINRMGFNNQGLSAVVERLENRRRTPIVGGNIGKNKITPNDSAVDDYKTLFEGLYDHVDYFVVNVSSPNTPNLRELQDKEPLKNLLLELMKLNEKKVVKKPILLKIAPDLTNEQLDDIVEIVQETKINGLIATNTTIDRSGLKASEEKLQSIGNGGLSGEPLKNRSTEVIRYLSSKSGKAFPIIGVGGIRTAEDVIEKLEAGASLVQLYTGFIYEGPSAVKRINKELIKYYTSQA